MTDLLPAVIDICVQKVNELSRNQLIWTDEDGFLLKPLGMLGSHISLLNEILWHTWLHSLLTVKEEGGGKRLVLTSCKKQTFRTWKIDDEVLFEIRHNEIHYADSIKLQSRRRTSYCLPSRGVILYVWSISFMKFPGIWRAYTLH